MLRKFVALGLVGLFLVMSLVVAEDGIGPYNPIADVNKDGIVDILDLVEVGQAYGSNCTSMHQANKATVTVLSYENNDFSFAENALVAILGGESPWKYTNSSGTAAFDLSANGTYVAVAWSEDKSRYNYANFTTDSLGEAAVTIWLSQYPLSSPIRSMPRGWIVLLFFDNNTDQPYIHDYMDLFAQTFNVSGYLEHWNITYAFGGYDPCYLGGTATGIYAAQCDPLGPNALRPNRNVFLQVLSPPPNNIALVGVYSTDEYGSAYKVYTIYRYW